MSDLGAQPRRLGKSSEIWLLLTLLSLIAMFYTWSPKSDPQITVSGLTLGLTTETVKEILGEPDFRGHGKDWTTQEYWAHKDRPQLVAYSTDNEVYRIEGGHPEIDGVDVSDWDFGQIQQKLGTPDRLSQGGPVGSTQTRSFMSYSQHRLLIQRENDKTTFLLFKSGKTSLSKPGSDGRG